LGKSRLGNGHLGNGRLGTFWEKVFREKAFGELTSDQKIDQGTVLLGTEEIFLNSLQLSNSYLSNSLFTYTVHFLISGEKVDIQRKINNSVENLILKSFARRCFDQTPSFESRESDKLSQGTKLLHMDVCMYASRLFFFFRAAQGLTGPDLVQGPFYIQCT
jgi:hypothetical protein